MTTLIPKFDLKDGGATPIGAVNRPINEKLAEIVSVLDFGAVGDGVTDDTAAIQACIDYAYSKAIAPTYNDQPVVYLPAGNYKITDSLVLNSYAAIKGDGPYCTTITASLANKSAIRTAFGESPTYVQRTSGWNLRDFFIQGSWETNSKGINMGSTGYSYISNVYVYNMDICFWTTNNGYYNTWDSVKGYGNTSMYLQSDGGANTIINPILQFKTNGIQVVQGDFCVLGGSVEGYGVLGYVHNCLVVGVTPTDGTTAALRVIGTYFETSESLGHLGLYNDTMYQCSLTNISKRGYASKLTVAVLTEIYIQAFLGDYNPNQNVMQVNFASGIEGPRTATLKAPSGNIIQTRNFDDSDYAYAQSKAILLSGAALSVAGTVSLGNTVSSTATSGSNSLPSNPAGFLVAYYGGTQIKIPYYNA